MTNIPEQARERGRDHASEGDAREDPVRTILVPALVIAALFGGLVAGARWRELTEVARPEQSEPVFPSVPLVHDPTEHGAPGPRDTVRCPDCCAAPADSIARGPADDDEDGERR